MLRYLARRIGGGIVVLLGVTLLTFALIFLVPGDPALMLAGPNARPEEVELLRRRLGLDQPWWAQYVQFLGRLLQGDLGRSYTGEPVASILAARLPATLALAATGLLSWVVFGIAFGTLVAWRRSRAGNAGLLAFSILGASVPTFWIGVLFLWLFGVQLRWFPVGGYGSWRHLVLPTLTLAVSGVATYARLAHAHLEAALQQDYLRTARAKGLPERRVMLRHALPNALLPLVTLAGSDLAVLIGGVVFTESVFNWPGIGRLAVERMSSLDIPVLMGIVLVTASTVVIVNLVLDLIYPLLDPRIRGEGERSPPA